MSPQCHLSILTFNSQNYFVDAFPRGLGMALGLTLLNAYSNNFSGDIAEDLGNNTVLETLDFRGNYFIGLNK